MVVLDDPFSALDRQVEQHISNALLSANGLFRKFGTTVVLINNDGKQDLAQVSL